jgi:hypothetical protein
MSQEVNPYFVTSVGSAPMMPNGSYEHNTNFRKQKDGSSLKKLLKQWYDSRRYHDEKLVKRIVQRILEDENGSELQEAIREQNREDWLDCYDGIDIFRKLWDASFCLSVEDQQQIYPLLESKLPKETFRLLKVTVRQLGHG